MSRNSTPICRAAYNPLYAHARVYPRPVAMTLNGSMSYKNSTAPQYGEMPAGAIATGAVDIIAPVEEMPGHLLRLQGSATDLTAVTEVRP